MGAAIVSSVERGSEESLAEASERFADAVFDKWGIGDEGCGNGVLLLLAVEDRQVSLLLLQPSMQYVYSYYSPRNAVTHILLQLFHFEAVN